MTPRWRASDAEMAVDAATVALVSIAICVAADALLFMTLFVPATLVIRFVAWARVRPRTATGGRSLAVELMLFGVATGLGAFNDWSSVVRHGVYEYSVPVWVPELTTIPVWMLLFWGMILRAMATLCVWQRLHPPAAPRDDVYLPGLGVVRSGVLKVTTELALVLATRQAIYRFARDPVWSWLPFAMALAVYVLLLRPERHERRLMMIIAVVGPLTEMLYIHVAGLHHYALGWLGGVPLWIALWWVLALVIWRDLVVRSLSYLATIRNN